MELLGQLLISAIVVGVAGASFLWSRDRMREGNPSVGFAVMMLLIVGGLAWFLVGTHRDCGWPGWAEREDCISSTVFASRIQSARHHLAEYEQQRARGLLAFLVIALPGVLGIYAGRKKQAVPAVQMELRVSDARTLDRASLVRLGVWFGLVTVAAVTFLLAWRRHGFFQAIDAIVGFLVWLGAVLLAIPILMGVIFIPLGGVLFFLIFVLSRFGVTRSVAIPIVAAVVMFATVVLAIAVVLTNARVPPLF